ncbi:LysR family transcriptional regulator [uncultured Desulfobacter sp.]|uniref:LysR family transcriptional regulator n=1 Tax=uncultured Desulfobacter sp. TaxID=240139 RepID=UPI002AAAC413|nr:LysR family transcriptional regulator [uncultured Desulfobacter sp.]
MSLRALRTLIAISHKGSFVAAAEHLGLTQAAVSLQIKNLEEELGTALFNRDGRKPKINASGRLAVERAQEIIGLFDGLHEELHPDDAIAGELSLGAVHTVVTGPLPTVLARLQSNHKHLRIRLFCSLSAELAKRIEEDDLDGALITEPIKQIPSTCQWVAYDTEHFYIAAPKGTSVHSEETLFREFPFVRFDRTAWAGTMIEAYLIQRGIRPKDIMEFDTCEAALSLVEQGLGITVVPLSNKRLKRVKKQFSLIPLGHPQLIRRVGLYQKRQHPKHGILKLILEEMCRETNNLD